MQKYEIKEGINLYYIEDRKYKTVSAALYLHRAIRRDEVTYNSLLSSVLNRGTRKLPDLNAVNEYLESLYGAACEVNIGKKYGVQSIISGFSAIADKYTGEKTIEKCIGLLLDFMFDPKVVDGAFDKSYVESEKKNLKDYIEGLSNDKRSYANLRCIEELCEGELMGIRDTGYVEDIADINEKNLYEHYRSIITESPISIFVSGDVDIDMAVSAFKAYLDKIEFNIKPLENISDEPRNTEPKKVVDRFDVNQGKLALGFKTHTLAGTDEYYTMLVANSVFGGGAHSKLFNNVREKMSLAYYVGSRYTKFSGIMLVSSGVEFANFKKAEDEIMVQLDAVKNGEFTDDELYVAKQAVINVYRSYFDSQFYMRDYYIGNILYDIDDTIEEAIEKVNAVDRDMIKEVFSKASLQVRYYLTGLNGEGTDE